MKVEEVDGYILYSIERAKMMSKLPQDFIMKQEGFEHLSNAIKNHAEKGHSDEIISAHVASYTIGYANGISDVMSLLREIQQDGT